MQLEKILTSPVKVLKTLHNKNVFMIFKNAYTSLEKYHKITDAKIYINQEVESLEHINILLRDPKKRFVSGVNSFLSLENAQLDTALKEKIETKQILNLHFCPQVYWLFNLYRYYKGPVTFYDYTDVNIFIPNHNNPPVSKLNDDIKQQIESIRYNFEIDTKLIDNFLNKTVSLQNVIQEFKDALS
tara:strand:+ start:89 stop:646 length:558 start_codon:yes stop_codon:yes gene_type:complete